jgi:hypothetical protein
MKVWERGEEEVKGSKVERRVRRVKQRMEDSMLTGGCCCGGSGSASRREKGGGKCDGAVMLQSKQLKGVLRDARCHRTLSFTMAAVCSIVVSWSVSTLTVQEAEEGRRERRWRSETMGKGLEQ